VGIDPTQLPPPLAKPSAAIVELRVGREVIPPEPRVALPLGRRTLTVRYTAPDPNGGPYLRFRYRFRANAEWTQAGYQREVVFSDLRPGTQRFEVQAASVMGEWGESAAVDVRIPAYFRETVWFQVIVWAVALGLFLFFYRMRTRARDLHLAAVESEVRRRRLAEASLRNMGRRLLSAQEDERRRIARELHDDVNQRLSVLAMELDLMESGRSRSANELSEAAKGIARDLHRLSYSLHPAKIEQLGLEKSLRSLCKETSQDGVVVEFEAENVPGELPPMVTIGMFRIAQEAIRNALTHSESKTIEVRLRSGAKNLELTVHDYGKGFDPESSGLQGLGMISMSERAGALGGELNLRSAPGEGTIVHVTMPLMQ
jgi:signal transduction histidine kinase